MDLSVFGTVHWIYLAVTLPLSALILFLSKRLAKTERAQKIVLKSLGALLLIWILINRLSQVYRYEEIRWEQIIPDSFCGMTSLVLALSVLFGKKIHRTAFQESLQHIGRMKKMFELYDKVRIKKEMITGIIVDISNIDGNPVYTVESDSEGLTKGYGGKWKLFDCHEKDIEKIGA